MKEYNYRIVEVQTGKVIKRPSKWFKKHKACELAAIAALDTVVDIALKDAARYHAMMSRQAELANIMHLTGEKLRFTVRKIEGVDVEAITAKYNIVRLARKAS
jgi:hypothetical protein